MAFFEVHDMTISFGGLVADADVNIEADEGQIVGLIGPNGAGKSTTLHAILGLVPARAGEIRLCGRSIRGRSPESIVRAGIALVPEGRRIYADFTVEENLRLGLVGRREGNVRTREQDLAWVFELFPVVADFRKRPAGALSGGQQQQLAIARALVASPALLLLDEPSLGLAPQLVDTVFAALREIRERGVTILLVEQRAMRTVGFADRTHVLANGGLRMTLTPQEAGDTERMVSAYFGS